MAPFQTSALDTSEWSASHPCRFTRQSPRYTLGGWVVPTASGRYLLPLPGIEPLLHYPARSLVAIPTELSGLLLDMM
jgi:hypothetical protein